MENQRAFSAQSLADRWGCEPSLVAEMIADGQIPAFRIGRRLARVSADKVEGKSLDDFRHLPKTKRPKTSTTQAYKLISAAKAIVQGDAVLKANGTVYFVQCGRYVKIGFTTKDIAARLSGLQTGNPFSLTIMGTIPAHHVLETELHQLLARQCHRDEWFRLTPAVRLMIAAICSNDARNVR